MGAGLNSQVARLRASVAAYEELREQQEEHLEFTTNLRVALTKLARELQKKKTPRNPFSHKSIRTRLYREKPAIPRTKMADAPTLRESWRDLSEDGVNQIKADKLSKVKRPASLLEGSRAEKFEQWEEDLDLMFLEGGVTLDEAKIYIAIRQMEYDLRKTCVGWDSSRGDSYEKFIEDVKEEIGFKEGRGSTTTLDRLVKRHQSIGL